MYDMENKNYCYTDVRQQEETEFNKPSGGASSGNLDQADFSLNMSGKKWGRFEPVIWLNYEKRPRDTSALWAEDGAADWLINFPDSGALSCPRNGWN